MSKVQYGAAQKLSDVWNASVTCRRFAFNEDARRNFVD